MTVEQIFWLGAFVVFLAIETGTLGLVSIWFAAGALGALLVSWLGGMIWLQVVVFLVVTCVSLASLRPLANKYIKPKITATNADSIIGSEGFVTEDIDNLSARGQVKLGGMFWSARSTSGDPISKDTKVKVDRIEGVKVFVSPE